MRHQPRTKRHDTGFTLIEVMVVIGIIAIAVGVAIPSIGLFVPNYKLKNAAQDLYSNMQLTKMEAVKMNTPRTITFNAGGYVKADGTAIFLADYGSEVVFDRPDAGANVTYTGGIVTFQPRGLAPAGEAYISNSRGTAYYVGTLSSGVVILRKWNGTSWQ